MAEKECNTGGREPLDAPFKSSNIMGSSETATFGPGLDRVSGTNQKATTPILVAC